MHTDKILEDTVGPQQYQSKSFNQNTETINMSAEIKPKRYREKNYGSILAKERKSPEGSACSTFGDSRVESLSDLGACESIEGDSSDDDEEEDFFYRNVMEKSSSPTTNQCFLRNNFAPQEEKWKNKEQQVCHGKLKNRFSDEDTTSQLKSVSEQYIPLAGQYKAYTLQDYKRQINVNLGGLGLDITANNEKMKLMMKQRRYGEKANLRNIKKLKESQLRKERDAKDKNRHSEESSSLVNSVGSLSKAQGKSVRSRRRKCISKKLQTEDKIVDSDVETRTLLNSLQDRHMKEVQLVESIINELL
ncbi:unnamed protein product [Timema podura]|uniref:Uncharacterized protein n=1 Tax=Timema podura TaxID=61482 RepID=A0ABN7NLN2_TIMPD|nr:unnamed protein product [Timema podura]